jgi:hypothetical protein
MFFTVGTSTYEDMLAARDKNIVDEKLLQAEQMGE